MHGNSVLRPSPKSWTCSGEARLGKAVDPSTTLPLVGEIAASVLRQPHALISVARIKTHDDYTYLHSVAVCALMLSLARHLDLDEEQTRWLASAD